MVTAILFLSGACAFVIAYFAWFITTTEADFSMSQPDEADGPEQILWREPLQLVRARSNIGGSQGRISFGGNLPD
jgi:hypothetical protein